MFTAHAMSSGPLPSQGPALLQRGCDATARDLSTRMAKGDTAAFDAWYRLWFEYCVAFTRNVSGRDESFAMDTVQASCLRIVARIAPMQSAAQLHAFIHKALINAVIDALRKESRRVAREARYAANLAAAHAQNSPGPRESGHGHGSHSSLDIESRIVWLSAVLADLPSHQRDLLQLHYVHNVSYLEAARITSAKSRGAVRTALDSILRTLRSLAPGTPQKGPPSK
jgi:RNA polymerase sigma factor (sigma-70 family)